MIDSTVYPEYADTVADLVRQLGDIPLERILMHPPPGTATEEDLIALLESPNKRLCELIDGVLVEKVMGAPESFLAAILLRLLGNFVEDHDLGLIAGADGPFRILPGQVRLPDISVFRWETLPSRAIPSEKVPRLVPDLAVEVLSEGNTRKEMQRKLKDYFLAGVKLVWLIVPKTRSAEVYTSPDSRKRVAPHQSLQGGDILPGFELPLSKLFERLEKGAKRKK